MKYMKYNIKMVCICVMTLWIGVLLSSCVLFHHPPLSLEADVEIDENGQVVLTNYYQRMAQYWSFKREHYILTGITVEENSCIRGECERRFWEVRNDLVWNEKNIPYWNKKNIPYKNILPYSITYGQPFPTLQETIPPEALKMDRPYLWGIGIMGINDDWDSRIYISADAHFMLTRDEHGAIVVKQSGKNGVRLQRVIITE